MWHRKFLLHKQIEGLFGDRAPSLEKVAVTELLFKPEKILFSAYVDCPGDVFPSAWAEKGFDSLQFRFLVSPAGIPDIVGTPVSSSESIIEFSDNRFSIRALDGSWSIAANAVLEIANAEPFQEPGPGHDHDWFKPSFRSAS
jgi:hypothetical protein